MWLFLILSLVTATLAASGDGELGAENTILEEDSEPIDICTMKLFGQNKALPPNLIPTKQQVSSTSIETWAEGDVVGFEIFGEKVFMSEVQEFIEASRPTEDLTIPNNVIYKLTVRADTFYCDRKGDDIADSYILNNFQSVVITARRMVSNQCHIKLNQPDVHTPQKPLRNGKSSSTYGKAGENGLNGINGVSGKGALVRIGYLEAVGKMRITGNGGGGSSATSGSDGGNGFRGKKGKDAPKINCTYSPGEIGGDGSNGGNGGNGGTGGNGGRGIHVSLETPNKLLFEMTFELEGCGGNGGLGASGGAGGMGGIKGIGGKGFKVTEVPTSYGPRCYRFNISPKDGHPGKHGKHGVPGGPGKKGDAGVFQKKSLGNQLFDGASWELILRKADGYYMHSRLADAEKLYRRVTKFADPQGPYHEYALVMFKRIKSGLTYYGFPADVVFAEDIDDSGERLKNSLKFVEDEDNRIDKMLYRRHMDNQQKVDFDGLTQALVANNDGLKEQNKLFIEIQEDQRNKVLVGIREIESDIAVIQSDFERKLQNAMKRLLFEMYLKVLKFGFLFVNPDINKADQVFSQAVDIGRDLNTCSSLLTSVIKQMKKRAIQYRDFKDFKVKPMNVFNLTPSIFTEMKKANSKSEIKKMKLALLCLIDKTGAVGKALETNLEIYLNYATARLSLIGRIYDIDLKTAEYMIKNEMLEERNTEINQIKYVHGAKTNVFAAITRVRLTEDLIETFKETERYALLRLYIHADSLRFQTLWDFSECIKYYNPTSSTRANRETYFDGYRAFEDVLQRIQKFHDRWSNAVGSLQTGKKWAFEVNGYNEFKDTQFVESLRKYKSGIFYFNTSRLCQGECANFRLHKVRGEVMLKDTRNIASNRFLMTLEHLGDNEFYTGSPEEEPIIIRQNSVNKIDLSSNISNPLIAPCTNKACEILNLPDSAMSNACTPKGGKGRREKRSYYKYYTPCRSPFARYKVNIPINEGDQETPQGNSARTNLNNIVGIRFVFEVSYWKVYSKGPSGCPKIQ